MSARAAKIAPARKNKIKQVVVGFDGELLKAPFILRCGAFLIDYILLVGIPVISLLLGRANGADGARLLNSEISNAGWVITLLLGLTNFIIFPMFSGQTVGKVVTGIQIARLDGSNPGFVNLLLRHFVGYPLTLLTGGLGFLFSAFTGKGRALHDYLSGTIVVYGKKKTNRGIGMKSKKVKGTKKPKPRIRKKAKNA